MNLRTSVLLGLCLCAASTAVDDYPTQPVTIVVGLGVGGSVDRMTRTMSAFIGEEFGQPVHVVNKKGAGTLLAANLVRPGHESSKGIQGGRVGWLLQEELARPTGERHQIQGLLADVGVSEVSLPPGAVVIDILLLHYRPIAS